ncbi:MAG: large conductance mechanosensitive channel protein MscL [Eubacteriales bacterium]|nr:large conductance mechanosensitive channel protein MscL [Eubacteriales bacterium]
MKKFWEEFKAFAIKGNVIDLAVAVVIGGAFGKIVSSLVNDLLMPLLTLLTGGINVSGLFVQLGKSDVPFTSVAAAAEAGVATLNYGVFIQAVIDFLLIALGIFLFVKLIGKLKKKEEAAPAPVVRHCSYCLEAVADDATRCPHCTSDIAGK